MAGIRKSRISELMRQIVSETLMFKVKNPQAKKATVQSVEVSDSYQRVMVFVSVAGGEAERKTTMKALDSAAGFVRRQIGLQASLRFTPEVKFVYDKGLDNADRISELLKSLK